MQKSKLEVRVLIAVVPHQQVCSKTTAQAVIVKPSIHGDIRLYTARQPLTNQAATWKGCLTRSCTRLLSYKVACMRPKLWLKDPLLVSAVMD